jgi:hypothetical protein
VDITGLLPPEDVNGAVAPTLDTPPPPPEDEPPKKPVFLLPKSAIS